MTFEAGKYRHRIGIQERVDTTNSFGEISTTWQYAAIDSATILDAVPAEVLTGPGKEYIAAKQPINENTTRFRFRWFPGLKASMRILWDDQIFNITSIETDATARREYRVKASTGASSN